MPFFLGGGTFKNFASTKLLTRYYFNLKLIETSVSEFHFSPQSDHPRLIYLVSKHVHVLYMFCFLSGNLKMPVWNEIYFFIQIRKVNVTYKSPQRSKCKIYTSVKSIVFIAISGKYGIFKWRVSFQFSFKLRNSAFFWLRNLNIQLKRLAAIYSPFLCNPITP